MKNLKKYIRNWYLKNRERLLLKAKLYSRQYRKTHKKEISIYRKQIKDKIKRINKRWRQNNKKYYSEYAKIKARNDINFKLKNNLRHRIWLALKGLNKSKHTENLLGCSIEYLKSYLKKQFKTGMTWDNYGKWHIDHIKGCKDFDLSKKSEQLKCFNYKNLQPLWAEENLVKHSRIRRAR
jgi:Ribonuclease G/E